MPTPTRRRTATAAGALLALVTVAACSEGSGQDSASQETGGTMTLATTSERGLELFMDDFEAETGISVSGTFAEAGALNDQLSVQLTSGTAPDIFRSAPGRAAPSAVLNLADQGTVLDLSDQPWAAHVPESFAPLQELDGTTYAYPTFGQALLAFYNVSVFEEVGVKAPTTWDEFVAVLDQLKAAGKVPLALGLADNYITQFLPFALAATLVDGQEPDFYADLSAGEASFAESAGWKESLEKFFWLIEQGYTTPDPLGMPGDPAMQQVGNGEAAIVVMPSGASPVLAGFMPGGEDDMGMFAVPATDDPGETHIPFSPDYLVVNAEADNEANALEFLDYISEPQRAADYAEAMGAIPALTNAEPLDNALNGSVQTYLDDGRTAPFSNHVWPGGEVGNAFMTGVQQVLQGDKAVDEVLADMDTAYAKAAP